MQKIFQTRKIMSRANKSSEKEGGGRGFKRKNTREGKTPREKLQKS